MFSQLKANMLWNFEIKQILQVRDELSSFVAKNKNSNPIITSGNQNKDDNQLWSSILPTIANI